MMLWAPGVVYLWGVQGAGMAGIPVYAAPGARPGVCAYALSRLASPYDKQMRCGASCLFHHRSAPSAHTADGRRGV